MTDNFDVTEQLARIEREHAHARQLQAEAALKIQQTQFGYLEPRRFWVSAVTAAAALLGAGAAIGGLIATLLIKLH